MQSIIQIREYYGFSQTNLAIYLSISTSLLKMVEQGKRELPAAASVKLAHLLNLAFGNQPNNPLPDSLTSVNKSKSLAKELNIYINRFEKIIRKNRLSLADMQIREQQATRRLQLIDQLASKLDSDEEGKKDKVWLELQELEIKEELKRYGQHAQVILQWRTDCYQLSIEQARKALSAYI